MAGFPAPAPAPAQDRAFFAFNAVVSAGALAFIAYILMIRQAGASSGLDLRFLPAVNACLNAVSASLLCAGWVAVKRRALTVHKYCMVSAFAASSLFLVCYLTYHYVHGDTRFPGVGAVRALYLVILASHVLLSMAVVPLALTAFYFAYRREFDRHTRVTRVALPIWLYVSVTGVVIYLMLRGAVPAVP